MNFSTTIFSFRRLLVKLKKGIFGTILGGKNCTFSKFLCVFRPSWNNLKNDSPKHSLLMFTQRKSFKLILLFSFSHVKLIEEGNSLTNVTLLNSLKGLYNVWKCIARSKCCRAAVCLSCTKPVIHSETKCLI